MKLILEVPDDVIDSLIRVGQVVSREEFGQIEAETLHEHLAKATGTAEDLFEVKWFLDDKDKPKPPGSSGRRPRRRGRRAPPKPAVSA